MNGTTFEVRVEKNKGRSLFTTRLVKGGEVVLFDNPIILLPANELYSTTCSHCLKFVDCQRGGLLCRDCSYAAFCCESCHQKSTCIFWEHSESVCRAYAQVKKFGVSDVDANILKFILHGLALRACVDADAAAKYANVMSLFGDPLPETYATAARMEPYLSKALGVDVSSLVSTAEIASLLRKEQVNAYGILARVGEDGERILRGGALYLTASFINHDCAPNVARFDNFDSDQPDSTNVIFRAMHDLPAGTEITQSYVPLHWDYSERQKQLRDVYGFTCTCARCKAEAADKDAHGSDSEWETESGSAMSDAVEESESQMVVEAEEQVAEVPCEMTPSTMETEERTAMSDDVDEGEPALEPAYLHLFLLKYICPQPNCYGTLAPILGTDVMECNVCGKKRSEAEFMAEVEASMS